MLEVEHEL